MHNHVDQTLPISFHCFTKVGPPVSQRRMLSRPHFWITTYPKIRSAEGAGLLTAENPNPSTSWEEGEAARTQRAKAQSYHVTLNP